MVRLILVTAGLVMAMTAHSEPESPLHAQAETLYMKYSAMMSELHTCRINEKIFGGKAANTQACRKLQNLVEKHHVLDIPKECETLLKALNGPDAPKEVQEFLSYTSKVSEREPSTPPDIGGIPKIVYHAHFACAMHDSLKPLEDAKSLYERLYAN